MLLQFFYRLRDEGISVGAKEILDFYRAPEKINIESVDDLFLLLKLLCVRRREDADVFERVFLKHGSSANGCAKRASVARCRSAVTTMT
jgi:uncharacterized protein with von Willebrand factor type A (vWA) domain